MEERVISALYLACGAKTAGGEVDDLASLPFLSFSLPLPHQLLVLTFVLVRVFAFAFAMVL